MYIVNSSSCVVMVTHTCILSTAVPGWWWWHNMHVCTLCEIIFKTCGLLAVLSSPPDTLPITLLGPHWMLHCLWFHVSIYANRRRSCFGKYRRKRNTAGEAESKGQSSASCTVYCPARRSSTMQKGARIPRRVYIRMYVQRPRTYAFVWPHMRSIRKVAQARPTMPAFL